MYDDIIYDETEDENITKDTFSNMSDDNKLFHKTSWFLRNNIKINLDILPIILLDLKANGRKVLTYILTHLKYNTNIISIDRKDVLKYLKSNDYAIITKGIDELMELHIIQRLEDRGKDVYKIPMNFLVRGNVNTMISIIEKEKEEEEIRIRENKQVLSYSQLSRNYKLKIKIKNDSKNQKTS